ncbi:MAG TPA: glycosyltransferase family 1 protein [Candidatus Woesebacteria bacterium]|jgi:glycosyltransferase involved in cell wall biosynthesis|nr:glycosyltransferase family 4 protein [Candidatus Shapirobacteria bacterium]HOR01658.1 glycosyltransferase family 1 protein [Candidatus Woesebacteria bacterium]
MIIGIDVSSVCYQTGVSNYTLNIVKNLINLDKTNHYKLFYSSLRMPLPESIKVLGKKPHVTIYHHRLPPTLLEILWNRLRILPIELFIGKCDIFHTSDWTQPPTISAKTIATIHDLTPFLYPQWHHPKVIKAHQNKMRHAVKKCCHLICVSQNTQSDLFKLFPQVDPAKTSVIYESAETKYSQFLKLPAAAQAKKKSVIKKQYGLNNFILAQGTREPRKNLNRLIDAFLKFKQKYPKTRVQLAITGKYGWGQDVTTKDPSIKILGFIPEKDMVGLHASAICLAYPSLYEGFGLPVVKSLKVGVPVITSHNSSLIEISQGAAILVDPNSTESIAKAIEKIVHSKKLRQQLSRRGIEIAKKFSWQTAAKQTLMVYTSLC